MIRDDYTTPCSNGRCARSADHGRYCCWTCAETMRRWLREIDDYTATLDAAPTRGGNGGRRAPGFGSRPPARLDVIAARDPRTLPYALGPDDTDNDARSILASLDHLARWITEETGDVRATHRPTITTEVRYLLGRIDWCTGHAWIAELADDLRELHAQARRLAGDAPPKPLAPCPDCAGPLWPHGETITLAVQCGNCARSYGGLDLISIGAELANQGAA